MNTTASGTAESTANPAAADAALLALVWLASPALPVGGFSYSEGLEAAVEAGLVRDEASAAVWLVDQLHAALARSDLAVVGAAVAAARSGDHLRLAELDAWVRQTRETSELRQQAEQMGRSLGEWAKSVGWGERSEPQRSSVAPQAGVPHFVRLRTAFAALDRFAHHQPTNTAWTYPVAFAIAAAASPASPRHIALAYAFAWSENMMQAAIKSVPLGQGAGQRILAALAAAIPAALDLALSLDDDARQAFTPMLAILSSQHETQYSRLFRS